MLGPATVVPDTGAGANAGRGGLGSASSVAERAVNSDRAVPSVSVLVDAIVGASLIVLTPSSSSVSLGISKIVRGVEASAEMIHSAPAPSFCSGSTSTCMTIVALSSVSDVKGSR